MKYKHFYNSLFLSAVLLLSFNSSCTQGVKKENEERFERQNTEISTDEMVIGDDVNYWGNDTPKAGIFVLKSRTSYLKGFALKPLSFKEKDKTQEQISKQIETDPIYQLEVYEIERTDKQDTSNPDICDYVQSNFFRATPLVKISSLSFRLKERNWVWINAKTNPNALIFVRLGVADTFSVIKNQAADNLIINAKRNEKSWEDFTLNDKKKITSWACQEANFMEINTFESLYYNPDVAFNFE